MARRCCRMVAERPVGAVAAAAVVVVAVAAEALVVVALQEA